MKKVLITALIFATGLGASAQKVAFKEDATARKVDVTVDGKYFTSYIYPADMEKPVLWPLVTASGKTITRGYPLAPRAFERTDHPHHVGLWFNFGDVNGLDFWNNSFAIPAEKKHKFGSIKHQSVKSMKGNKLVTISNWVDNNGAVLLEEETTFEFGGSADTRTIIRTAKLTAKKDVKFTGNKEGMLALRMDRAFEEPATKPEKFTDANGVVTDVPVLNNEGVNGVYINSLGDEKGNVWSKRAAWTTLNADMAGDKISVLVIDNKKNPNFPAWSHARGYGLFATNSMGGKDFDKTMTEQITLDLPTGKSVSFKYEIVIKDNGFLTTDQMNNYEKKFNK